MNEQISGTRRLKKRTKVTKEANTNRRQIQGKSESTNQWHKKRIKVTRRSKVTMMMALVKFLIGILVVTSDRGFFETGAGRWLGTSHKPCNEIFAFFKKLLIEHLLIFVLTCEPRYCTVI